MGRANPLTQRRGSPSAELIVLLLLQNNGGVTELPTRQSDFIEWDETCERKRKKKKAAVALTRVNKRLMTYVSKT